MPYEENPYRYEATKILVDLRKRAGLSQDEAGDLLGLEGKTRRNRVSDYELGKSRPARRQRENLIRYLLYLLDYGDEPQSHSSQEGVLSQLTQIWNDVMVKEWGWTRLHELELDHYKEGARVASPRQYLGHEDEPSTAGESWSWPDLVAVARRQSARCLETARGEGRGKYMPSVYCSRESIDKEVKRFLIGDKTGMLITGKAGRGKTTLLCWLAERLYEQGHVVLLYDCGSLSRLDIGREIAEDLALPQVESPTRCMERISLKAVESDRYCIVLFDAINEFKFGGASRDGDLLQSINSWIGRCSHPRIKAILTCRTPSWERLDIVGYTKLEWGRYHVPSGEAQTFVLPEFTPEEFERAYPRYRERFRLKSDRESLSPTTVRRCLDPLLLRLTASAYSGEAIPLDAPSMRVFAAYFERIGRRGDRQFLEQVAAEMWSSKTTSLSYETLASHRRLGAEMQEGRDCAYERLKDLGILLEVQSGLFTYVQFTHERIFEYVLARRLIRMRQGDISLEFIESLLDDVWTFTPLWGTVQFMLWQLDRSDLFCRLAASDDFTCREIAVEALVTLFRDRPAEAENLLVSLLEAESLNSKRTALKAAHLIGPPAQRVFLEGAASSDERTRRTVIDLLQVIGRDDIDFVLHTWRELATLLTPRRLVQRPFRLLSALEIALKVSTNYFYDDSIMREVSRICYDSCVISGLAAIADSKGSSVIPDSVRQVVHGIMTRVLDNVLMSRLFRIVTFDEYMSFDQIWKSRKERELIAEIGRFYDLRTEGFEEKLAVIYELLNSPLVMSGVAAMAVLTTRTFAAPDLLLSQVREMFQRCSGTGRMWIIGGFALGEYLPMPEYCMKVLEEFTEVFVRENSDVFLKDPWGMFDSFDFPLSPLGLAYGKIGQGFPLFRDLLQDFTSKEQIQLSNRMVEALGTVGIYYPKAVLAFLEENLDINDRDHRDSLVHTLAMIRTSYLDEADRFLIRHNVDDSFRYEVQIKMDIDRNRRVYDYLGSYAFASYLVLHPELPLSQWLSKQLEVFDFPDSPEQFMRKFTQELISLLRDYDWQLDKMMSPRFIDSGR